MGIELDLDIDEEASYRVATVREGFVRFYADGMIQRRTRLV
jgi:hypothetical protein